MDVHPIGESDLRAAAAAPPGQHVAEEDDEVQALGYRLVGHTATIQGIDFSRLDGFFPLEKKILRSQSSGF